MFNQINKPIFEHIYKRIAKNISEHIFKIIPRNLKKLQEKTFSVIVPETKSENFFKKKKESLI